MIKCFSINSSTQSFYSVFFSTRISRMDNLFCNEEHVWLMMSPSAASPDQTQTAGFNTYTNTTFFNTSKQDLEEAFELYRDKEQTYMPQSGYMDLLDSDRFIRICRRKAIQWLLQVSLFLRL